jgi:pimeloyl-ACP methyl ester carboxylesterase
LSRNVLTNLLLFVSSLTLAYVSHEFIRHENQNLEFVRSRIPGVHQTPLLTIQARSASPKRATLAGAFPPPKVLLLHGLSASKSVMTHLGTELAKLGMISYLIDLPGHGESKGQFTWANCQSSLHEALKYLSDHDSTPPSSATPPSAKSAIVLVGHSMGGALAVQAAARNSPSVTGVIAVSPAAAQVDRDAPRNLLILLGEFDLPFVRRGASLLFAQATGSPVVPLDDLRSCSNPDGSKKLVVLPWTEHSLGIFEPRGLAEISGWLTRFCPGIHFDARSSFVTLVLEFFVCCPLVYALVPAFGLVHWAVRFLQASRSLAVKEGTDLNAGPSATPAEAGWLKGWSPLFLYGMAGLLSVVLLRTLNPWDRLRLLGGGYLCGFLCLTGTLALCCRRPSASSLRSSWVDWVSVVVSVGGFVVLAAPVFSGLLVHLTLSKERFWRFPIIAASTFPFYIYDEWASRRLIPSFSFSERIYFHFSTRLLLALILILGFFILQNQQFLIVLILPAMLALSTVCWGQAWGVCKKTESITASAAFSALLTAWFLSTFFVQT